VQRYNIGLITMACRQRHTVISVAAGKFNGGGDFREIIPDGSWWSVEQTAVKVCARNMRQRYPFMSRSCEQAFSLA